MPLFTYEAITADGALEKGSLAAGSVTDLERALLRKRLELVRLLNDRPLVARRTRKVKLRDVAEFARYVSITCKGGLSIVESIDDFARQTTSSAMRAVLTAVVADVRAGMTLSEAMARHQAFGDDVLALTQAGEASGAMDEVMLRLAEQLEFQLDVRGKVKGALIYPCIIGCAVIGLVVLLITFLLPRIIGMLLQNDVQLPAPTRFLLAISGFLRHWWPAIVCGIVAAVTGIRLLAASPRGAIVLDRIMLALPVLGSMAKMGAESRFTSTLRTLLGSGVEAVSALEMAADTCGAPSIAAATRGAAERLREGKTFSEALRSLGIFRPLVLRMVELGERTGHMEDSLKACVDHFAAEVPKAVRRCIAVLEPAIIVFAGAAVGFVLLATLLPVFSLYEAV